MENKIETKIVNVTPDIAKDIIENHNSNNRSIKKSRVELYAQQMARGEWELNGESIVIDDNGDLKDGQHRLLAVIKSGKTIQMNFVTGVSSRCEIYDRGSGRTIRDIISINYNEQWMRCSQIISVCKLFIKHVDKRDVNDDRKVIRFMNEYSQDLINLYEVFYKCSKKYHYSWVGAGVFLHIHYGTDINKLKRFEDVYASGIMKMKNDSPAIMLKNYAIEYSSKVSVASQLKLAECSYKAISDFENYDRRKKYVPSTSDHSDSFIEEMKQKGF